MEFKTIKQALAFVGGFTTTTKMPCESYDLPVDKCNVGSKLKKVAGTVCSMCYAARGNYHRYAATIKPVQERRLASIASEYWVKAMAFIINKRKMPYFRFHSAGDIQSVTHFTKICELAKLTPNTRHWIPTRELSVISTYVSNGGIIPENLIVRLSAYKLDSKGPEALAKRLGVLVSTVVTEGATCPAYKQDGKCLDCRACWDKTIFDVGYKKH